MNTNWNITVSIQHRERLHVDYNSPEIPVVVDTIVMANLGYFQLNANPGAWTLKLRAGKSAEIYDVTRYEVV